MKGIICILHVLCLLHFLYDAPSSIHFSKDENTAKVSSSEASEAPQPETPSLTIGPVDISQSIYQIDNRWIGSGNLSTYYFADSGWYCYLASDYGIKAEHEILSQRGQWSCNGGIILLTAKEQVTAEGGQMEFSPISGENLQNYRVHHFHVDQTIEYNFSIQYDDIGHYLAMGPMSLYPGIQLNEAVRIFAEEGYDAYANLPDDQRNVWQLNLPIDEYH